MSAIGRVIMLSKVILELKAYKAALSNVKGMNATIHVHSEDQNEFVKMLSRVDARRLEINGTIKLLLQPFFGGKDFDYQSIHNWTLTLNDMTRGYVDLYEITGRDNDGNPIGQTFRHILFLSDYKDSAHGIHEGNLLPFNSVASILGNQKNVAGNTTSIVKMLLNSPIVPPIKERRYGSK